LNRLSIFILNSNAFSQRNILRQDKVSGQGQLKCQQTSHQFHDVFLPGTDQQGYKQPQQ